MKSSVAPSLTVSSSYIDTQVREHQPLRLPRGWPKSVVDKHDISGSVLEPCSEASIAGGGGFSTNSLLRQIEEWPPFKFWTLASCFSLDSNGVMTTTFHFDDSKFQFGARRRFGQTPPAHLQKQPPRGDAARRRRAPQRRAGPDRPTSSFAPVLSSGQSSLASVRALQSSVAVKLRNITQTVSHSKKTSVCCQAIGGQTGARRWKQAAQGVL